MLRDFTILHELLGGHSIPDMYTTCSLRLVAQDLDPLRETFGGETRLPKQSDRRAVPLKHQPYQETPLITSNNQWLSLNSPSYGNP
eukprot:s95_g15.t1